MKKSEVVDRIKEIIAGDLNVKLSVEEIKESDSLFEDGIGLDSVAIMEFIAILEDRFNFQFSDDDLTKDLFQDISTIAEYVTEQTSQQA